MTVISGRNTGSQNTVFHNIACTTSGKLWHQPCKNQTALLLQHVGGYSKRAVKLVTHLESRATSLVRSESVRERRTALYESDQQQQHKLLFKPNWITTTTTTTK